MKKSFIINFLETFTGVIMDMGSSWNKVSYKGVRYSTFLNGDSYNRRKACVGFKNLESRGLIKNKGSDQFVFTKDGQKWLNRSLIKYFKTKVRGRWDKKWRVIIFDIPQELNQERSKFRRKLKWLGCAMLQESVFVFPYPCEEEIGDVAKVLKVEDYIDVIMAESLGFKEEEFLKIFDLKK